MITGFAVGASRGSNDEKRILEIISVLDDGLTLSQEVLRLTQWMSDYYCAGWGEVLRTALPGGGGPRRTRGSAGMRVCTMDAVPSSEEVDRVLARSPRQKELLAMIQRATGARTLFGPEVEGVRWEEIPNHLRAGPLKALTARGWVRVVEVGAFHPATPFPASESRFGSMSDLSLSGEQKKALKAIVVGLEQEKFQAFLLKGVTGSGKTEVYLRAIDHVLESGRDAIVLVPEIALTPQVLQRFRTRFGHRVAEFHSGLTMSDRIREWRRTADGNASIVIGARSAVFAPVRKLGIIVVDEEHESSYKQEETPRYNARDVALVRARQAGACAVLGSATPSLESFHNAQSGKYGLLHLPKRVEERPLPNVNVVDLRQREIRGDSPADLDNKNGGGSERGGDGWILSRPMLSSIQACLDRGEQALLFLNRRGFASCIQCRDCGWTADCPHCSVTLTYHLAERNLRCHYCSHRSRSPEICPDCSGMYLDTRGIGTQRVENLLKERFPMGRIARMDRDTTRSRGAHGRILRSLAKGEIDILVGTQMVAKGHDYPGITLVGVIQADATLNMPDFRAGERTFQLLTQVAGRAGRGDTPGEVIIQTFRPDHYAVRHAAAQDYDGFVRDELQFRRELGYPPYARMVRFRIEAREAESAERFAVRLAMVLGKRTGHLDGSGREPSYPELLGPAPGVFGKLQGRHRWQVALKDSSAHRLSRLVQEFCRTEDRELRPPTGVRLSVDVDPIDLY